VIGKFGNGNDWMAHTDFGTVSGGVGTFSKQRDPKKQSVPSSQQKHREKEKKISTEKQREEKQVQLRSANELARSLWLSHSIKYHGK